MYSRPRPQVPIHMPSRLSSWRTYEAEKSPSVYEYSLDWSMSKRNSPRPQDVNHRSPEWSTTMFTTSVMGLSPGIMENTEAVKTPFPFRTKIPLSPPTQRRPFPSMVMAEMFIPEIRGSGTMLICPVFRSRHSRPFSVAM